MSTVLKIDGLNELRAALRNLPHELANEAGVIVVAHAEDAQRRMRAAYPEGRTGNLRRGLTVSRSIDPAGASARVQSRAKHAWLYENGSRQRHTDRGANRGRMPQAPASRRFIPIAIKVRAQMVRALVDLVRRAGFEVSG